MHPNIAAKRLSMCPYHGSWKGLCDHLRKHPTHGFLLLLVEIQRIRLGSRLRMDACG